MYLALVWTGLVKLHSLLYLGRTRLHLGNALLMMMMKDPSSLTELGVRLICCR